MFPDTVQNEGRFWRNAWSGKDSLNGAQWVGVLILFFGVGGCLAAYLWMLWPKTPEPWWQKVIDGYAVYIIVIGAAAILIVRGNRKARLKSKRN